jgi:mannosyltransferase
LEIESNVPETSPHPLRSLRLKIFIFTIIILLLAAFLRFHNLDAQSFWNDEGNSARLSERSIQLIIEGTASDIHPPLYYLLLRGWRELVGDSEFGLRSLSAFAGLVVVAGTLALGKITFQHKLVLSKTEVGVQTQRVKRFVRTAVLLGALITAVSPPLVYYSQEARMYALLALEATLSTLFLLLWWQSINRHSKIYNQQSVLFAVGYVVFATAGLYTQYAFPVVIVAQNIMLTVLIIRDLGVENGNTSFSLQSLISNLKRPVLTWLIMMLAVFLLYLPWLPIFLGNIGGGPVERPFLPDYLLDVVRWLAFGHTVDAEAVAGSLTAVLILMGLGIVLDRSWRTAVWLSVLLIPVFATYYVGAFEPKLFKILLIVIVPFALMNVMVVFASRPEAKSPDENSLENYFFYGKWRLQFVGILIFLGLLASLGIVYSLANIYTNPDYARADYRGLAAQIAADNHPNAGVILNAPNQWEVFTYYHTTGAPVYPLPTAGMGREDLQIKLADIASQHDRLYVIYWGDGQQDPERVMESWLDENTYKATSDWSQDVRFVMYAVSSGPAAELKTPVALRFGDHISFEGYTLAQSELSPGDILQLTLFWQTDVPLPERYKVFLHLLDANGQLVAQRDSEPGGTLKPTNTWLPNETILDNHGLLIPTDLLPGKYTLVLGLYDIADPDTRLPIQTPDGSVDALLVETITITE